MVEKNNMKYHRNNWGTEGKREGKAGKGDRSFFLFFRAVPIYPAVSQGGDEKF